MKITLRHCTTCPGMGQHAARVADKLRKHGIADVDIVHGGRGEFTVLLDGREVASADGVNVPNESEVIRKVIEHQAVSAYELLQVNEPP